MRAFVIPGLAALAFASPAMADILVGDFGVNGWRSGDTRSGAGVNMRSPTLSHLDLGGVYDSSHDATIMTNIQFVDDPHSPSVTGVPPIMTGSYNGLGAVQLYATTLNPGKGAITRRDVANGLAPSSALLANDFFVNYRQYTIADTTFRTPGLNISVTNGANTYVLVYTDPAHTTSGVWTTTSAGPSTPFFLYGPGAPGGAGPAMTMSGWQSDPTWGPVLFASGVNVTEFGFVLGSFQRNAYVYVDYVETSLLEGGERIDFIPAPGSAALVGAGGLMALRRRRK